MTVSIKASDNKVLKWWEKNYIKTEVIVNYNMFDYCDWLSRVKKKEIKEQLHFQTRNSDIILKWKMK